MKTVQKRREIVRFIASEAPESIKALKFNTPKEGSSLEEYLLYRYRKYILKRGIEDAKLLFISTLDDWEFNPEDKNLRAKWEKFLISIDPQLFRSKASIYKEWFRFIWPLLIALFVFILGKIFK